VGPPRRDAADPRPTYASISVLAATIWLHATRTVQTASANTGVESGLWPLYGSNSGHFMVQVTDPPSGARGPGTRGPGNGYTDHRQ
jgi:hypothetical protein